MTFNQQWEAARFNAWYWLSYAAMLVLPVIGGVIVAKIQGESNQNETDTRFAAGDNVFLATVLATILSIEVKWELRRDAAQTPAQQALVANADGGNLAFAPIIGAFCGGISALIGLLAIRVARIRFEQRNLVHSRQ